MFPKAPKGPPHLACPLLSKQDFYCYLGLLKRKYASLRQSFFLFPVNFRIDMHHNVFYLRKCLFNAVMHHLGNLVRLPQRHGTISVSYTHLTLPTTPYV